MAQYQIDAERLIAQLAEQESIIEALSGGSYMRGKKCHYTCPPLLELKLFLFVFCSHTGAYSKGIQK